MMKKAPRAVIVERSPAASVVIQMHYRSRTAKGKMTEKKSRSITVRNLTLDQVAERVRRAFSDDDGFV